MLVQFQLWAFIMDIIKKCKKHGDTTYRLRKNGYYRCIKCCAEGVSKYKINKKKKLISILGGKCKLCGYNKCIGALEFHHLNPKEKEFSLSANNLCYSWEKILKEGMKCELLCANCHREVHY